MTLKVSDTPKVTDTLVQLFKIDMETSKAAPQGIASTSADTLPYGKYRILS